MERPSRFIDAETGEVEIVLCPHHLERLHGAWDGPTNDATSDAGLPFPLLPGATALTVRLHGGMSPEEIKHVSPLEPNSALGSTSWFRWHAYALLPYGWSAWPTPFFKHGRLKSVQFDIVGDEGQDHRLSRLRETVVIEMGEPDER
jgi:hypothetical protein